LTPIFALLRCHYYADDADYFIAKILIITIFSLFADYVGVDAIIAPPYYARGKRYVHVIFTDEIR